MYPFDLSHAAMVGTFGASSSARDEKVLNRSTLGRKPVITDARDAPHTGTAHTARSKTNALSAKASKFGVCAIGLP